MRKIPLFVVVILVAFSSGSSINTIKRANLDLSFVNAISQNEDAKFVIDKLSLTARIVTAISLQIGLSNGKIPVDNVISELMNLGSIDLTSLENFDKTKVENFFKTLKSVDSDKEAAEVENALIKWYSIKNIWSNIGDSSKLPDGKTLKKLDELKKVDVSGLDSLSLDDSINLLGKFSTLNDQDIGKLKTSLISVFAEIKKTKGVIKYNEILDTLNQFKPFSSIAQLFPLYDTLGTLEVSKRDTQIGAVVSNFNRLKKLTSSKDSASTLKAIEAVISSRFIHYPTQRTHTAGFINGFNDLDKLTEDVTDEWLHTIINPSVNISGVELLVQLKEPMKKVDDEWSKVSNPQVYYSVKQVAALLKLLGVFETIPSQSELETAMTSCTSCEIARVRNDVTVALTSFASNVETLKRRISTLVDIHEQKNIEEIIKSITKNTKEDDIQKLKDFVQKSKVVQGDKTSSMQNIVLAMGSAKYITDFANGKMTVDFVKTFECSKKLDGTFVKVVKAVELAYHIREINANVDMFTNIQTVSSALSQSSGSLKSIRAVVDKIKKEQNEYMESLNEFVGLRNYSKPFGEAVTSLVSMNIVSEKKTEFESFVDNGRGIENAVKSSKLVEIEKAFGKDWGDFGETAQTISALDKRIKEWQSGFKLTMYSNLSDYGSIFPKLAGLPSIDLQTENRLAAVDNDKMNIIKVDKNIDEFKKSLLELSKLDLQFSRYKSSVMSMPDTLKHVSHVLASASGLTKSTTEEYEDGGGETETWLILGFSTYFIVIFIVFGCHVRLIRKYHKELKGCVRYIKPKNKKNKKNKKSADVEAGKKKGKKSKSKSKTKKAEKSEVDTLQMSTTSTTSKIG